MTFDEWMATDDEYYPEYGNMRAAWDAAIEEAAIIGGHACESCTIPDGQKVADKIRNLKNE